MTQGDIVSLSLPRFISIKDILQNLKAHHYLQVNVVIIKGNGNITTIINGNNNNVAAISKGKKKSSTTCFQTIHHHIFSRSRPPVGSCYWTKEYQVSSWILSSCDRTGLESGHCVERSCCMGELVYWGLEWKGALECTCTSIINLFLSGSDQGTRSTEQTWPIPASSR